MQYIVNVYITVYERYIILHVILRGSPRALDNPHIKVKLVEQSKLKL